MGIIRTIASSQCSSIPTTYCGSYGAILLQALSQVCMKRGLWSKVAQIRESPRKAESSRACGNRGRFNSFADAEPAVCRWRRPGSGTRREELPLYGKRARRCHAEQTARSSVKIAIPQVAGSIPVSVTIAFAFRWGDGPAGAITAVSGRPWAR